MHQAPIRVGISASLRVGRLVAIAAMIAAAAVTLISTATASSQEAAAGTISVTERERSC